MEQLVDGVNSIAWSEKPICRCACENASDSRNNRGCHSCALPLIVHQFKILMHLFLEQIKILSYFCLCKETPSLCLVGSTKSSSLGHFSRHLLLLRYHRKHILHELRVERHDHRFFSLNRVLNRASTPTTSPMFCMVMGGTDISGGRGWARHRWLNFCLAS